MQPALDWIWPALGAAVLGLLGYDVFRTAFHAEGRGGPINRRQNRVLWRLVRWAGTRGGRPRPRLLSLGGPLMAVTTIAVWSVLLVAGFMLIYLPFILDFHYSPGRPDSALLEALYYSGIIAATLGHGDVVAADGWLRVLTVVQAMAGFASITVAVTYVLAIYREIIQVQALAAAIDARVSAREGEAERPPEPREPADDGWDRSIALGLAHVLESHFNYPILHYFRPSQSRRALPVQVARVHGSESARREGPSSRRALMGMVHRYIVDVHELFLRGEAVEGEDDAAREAERLRQILRMMAYDDALPGPGATRP